MKIHALPALLASCTLLAGVSAVANEVVDQSDLTNDTYMAGFVQTDLAQSFIQSADNISGAGILLEDAGQAGNPGDVTISLWTNLPNDGGSEQASGTAAGTAGQWVYVYWNPVAVAPDTTEYLVFTSSTNSGGITGDYFNGYPNGEVFANPGYVPFPEFDYTFVTFTDNSNSPGVPDGASTALLFGGALIGMAACRRRKTA
jgi:hypothetical protein